MGFRCDLVSLGEVSDVEDLISELLAKNVRGRNHYPLLPLSQWYTPEDAP